jgi:hypothetical protein
MRRLARLLLAIAVATAPLVATRPPEARAGVTTIDPDGTLRVDGERWFPVGMIHVSWIGDRQADKAIPDLQQIAEAGFDAIHATLDLRPSTIEFLDAAEALGVRVWAEIPWAAAGGVIPLWKGHPAIVAWNVADDFNAPYTGPLNRPPAEVAARTAFVHGLDPLHVTLGSGGSFPGFRIAEYLGTMDVMAFQSYPFGAGNNDAEEWLQEHADSWTWVRSQVTPPGQTILSTPQAFDWNGGGSNWPSPRALRNMLYVPLMRGARGLLWYTFWDGGQILPAENPALWDELARETAEMHGLVPFLLDGSRTDLGAVAPRIYAAVWERAQQLLVVVASTDRLASHGVSVPLPPGTSGAVHYAFPARPESGLALAGASLAGTVGPEETHVVLVDVVPVGEVAPVAHVAASPATASFGDPQILDGTGSTDADGAVVSWTWDLGDGTLAAGPVVTHTYARPGDYTVRLTVHDDAGNPATTFTTLTVRPTALCDAAPRSGCVAADRSSIQVKEFPVGVLRTLTWMWKGPAANPQLFGDPTAGVEHALCVYDAAGLRLATGTRGQANAWRTTGTTGWRLRQPTGVPGGVISGTLKASRGTGSVKLQARGAKLPDPDLPLAVPVTVQLVREGAPTCFEATYVAGPRVVSTDTRFSARR